MQPQLPHDRANVPTLLLVSILPLLLGSACSSSTEEHQPITSSPEDYCQRTCTKAHTCDDTTDAAECRSTCQSGLAAKPKLRADFLGYVAGCIDGSSCSPSSASKCKSEAQAQLSPSQYGKTLCTAFVAAGSKCDASGTSYPESACLEAAKSYDDSALQGANACLAQACEALNACLTRAIPEVALMF